MKELIAWWQELSSSKRHSCKRIGIGSVAFMLICASYHFSRGSKQTEVANVKPIVQEIGIGVDGLEQDIHASVDQRVDRALDGQTKTIQELREQLKALQDSQEQAKKQQILQNDLTNFLPKNIDSYNTHSNSHHSYPASPTGDIYPATPTIASEAKPLPERQVLGNISFTAGAPVENGAGVAKKKTIYLPPSFMPAKLMTGIDARTSQHAESNPEPIMFRVQAPAVLPNHLKANLKGCFVVADAIGDLSKERVKVRLQSISCLTRNGNAVIDQKIKGFVTDEDGKRDMAGIVISRAGSHLARSFAAGLVGGLGDAVQSASTMTNINPLGATQTLKSGGVAKAAVGGGLKGATGELQQFYLDLAKQAMPVIEVGAAKNVTVVVQQGVELEIKEF